MSLMGSFRAVLIALGCAIFVACGDDDDGTLPGKPRDAGTESPERDGAGGSAGHGGNDAEAGVDGRSHADASSDGGVPEDAGPADASTDAESDASSDARPDVADTRPDVADAAFDAMDATSDVADAADAGPQPQGAWFRRLGSFGTMTPGMPRISANGRTVVGYMWPPETPEIPDHPHVFRWSEATGVVDMGLGGVHTAVNGDGSVIAAGVHVGNEPNHAHRWTAASGWVSLEDPGAALRSSDAIGINPAGTMIVGETRDYGAFRWTAASGMIPLLGSVRWTAHATSDDGSVIVGRSYTNYGQAIRWMESTGPVTFLGTGFVESQANDVSGDGRVVVGYINDADNWQGFRWTADGGLQRLGEPFSYTFARATNTDGSVVVGSDGGGPGGGAFVWEATHGVRRVHSVLEQAGIHLSGWTLFHAWDVSADGTIIVGSGMNPDGGPEVWMARLP